MEEVWKNINGYEGLYEVSNLGNVRSLDRITGARNGKTRVVKGKLLNSYKQNGGYLYVDLYTTDKTKCHKTIHRLVANAFIPNPNNLPEVNHKDEDKTNNSISNLEWCDHSYNNIYGTKIDRMKSTMIKNGYYTGLSKNEVKKIWYNKHKNEINIKRRLKRQVG